MCGEAAKAFALEDGVDVRRKHRVTPPSCLTCGDGTIGGNGARDGPEYSECVHAVSVGEKVPAAEHFEVTRLLHIVNA